LVLLLPASGFAQCEPRGAVGGSAGLLTLDFPVDPVAAGIGRNGLATTTGNGLEVSAHAVIPLAPEWRIAAEIGGGRMAVQQERDDAGDYVTRALDEKMKVRRLQVGVQRHRAHRTFCDYIGVSIGLYRYDFSGVSLAVPGGAATMGFEFPHSGSGAFFFELGMSVAVTALKPPTAQEVVVNIRPAFGWRYRF
jgi:hypothetical protein